MLNDAGKAANGSRVLAVGVTYKSGVADIRESPAISVIERLAGKAPRGTCAGTLMNYC
jgi:UDP-N-acetyl-D-glucosamine dehydrogenase